MNNLEYLRKFNNEHLPMERTSIALDVISKAVEEKRIRKFMVDTKRFKIQKWNKPTLYVIGKSNKSDTTIYAVAWFTYSKYEGRRNMTVKLYTRNKIDWFEFTKLKEYKNVY